MSQGFSISDQGLALERNMSYFIQKPVHLMGIRVTLENIFEVAQWCKGSVLSHTGNPYVFVPVRNPKNDRATKAYVGDWVTRTDRGMYRVYLHTNLFKAFELID